MGCGSSNVGQIPLKTEPLARKWSDNCKTSYGQEKKTEDTVIRDMEKVMEEIDRMIADDVQIKDKNIEQNVKHGPGINQERSDHLDEDMLENDKNTNIAIKKEKKKQNPRFKQTDVLDTRDVPWFANKPPSPVVLPGGMYTDQEFTPEVAMRGMNPKYPVTWKRIKEFAPCPLLFPQKGTSRFDIKQGYLGNCWFVSTLAGVAEYPEAIKQLIPKQQTNFSDADYNGVFHCRFYRSGEWHDIYCDDYLPYYENRQELFCAKSPEKNVMWVALLEKAFAKFAGGYKKILGHETKLNAFESLMAGKQEYLMHNEKSPTSVFNSILVALNSKCVITCSSTNVPSVGDTKCRKNGIVNAHGHTIVNAKKIEFSKETVSLVCIRNPWGKEKGQWLGKWSNDSNIWNMVPGDVKALKVMDKEAGEYWMELEDFYNNFEYTSLCSLLCPSDIDAALSGHSNEFTIMSNWRGGGGLCHDVTMEYLFGEHQSYRFDIHESDLNDHEDSVPIGLYLERISLTDEKCDVFFRPDFYKLSAEINDGDNEYIATLCLSSKTKVHERETWRHNLKPGKYIITPHTHKEVPKGEKIGYIIKIISNVKLKSWVYNKQPEGVIQHWEDKVSGVLEKANCAEAAIVANWKGSTTDNYRLTIENIFTDAQPFMFYVPEKGRGTTQPVVIYISQVNTWNSSREKDKISFLPDVYEVCASLNKNNREHMALNRIEFKRSFSFSGAWKLDLKPGKYIITVRTYKPVPAGYNVKFVLTLVAKNQLNLEREVPTPISIFAFYKSNGKGRDDSIEFVKQIFMEFDEMNQCDKIQVYMDLSKIGRSVLVWVAFTGSVTKGNEGQLPWPPFDICKLQKEEPLPVDTKMSPAFAWKAGFYNDYTTTGGNFTLEPGHYLVRQSIDSNRRHLCFSLGIGNKGLLNKVKIRISPERYFTQKMQRPS